MTVAELVTDLRARGVRLTVEGGRLTYDAPKGVVKPSELEELRSHRAELLAYLKAQAANTTADPAGPCPACGAGQFWQLPGEPWHCRHCEPDMPLTATSLTLACHKPRSTHVHAREGLRKTLEAACEGLDITPDQLCAELDLADLESGVITPNALRLTARPLNLMRHEERTLAIISDPQGTPLNKSEIP
jgi:hypothetical protein